MSIEQLGEKEFARRNLWEATLFDEGHNPIIWSTGLIKSTNIPKLSFTVEDILAGTSKGYMGWKLPDNLSIGIWETSDHTVEKYLDEWMLGKTGIFNPETGAFRVQSSEDYLYRDVKIKTFIYEYTESKPYQVKKKDVVSALFLTMLEGLQEQTGAVSVDQQEYIHAASEIAVSEMEKIIANQHESMTVKEKINSNVNDSITIQNKTSQNENDTVFITQNTPMQKIITVEKKQVIPVLDKLVSAISGLANQAIARVPVISSDLTRKIIPPVIIPPVLMQIPIPTGMPFPQMPMIQGKSVRLQNKIIPSSTNNIIRLQDKVIEAVKEKTVQLQSKISESVNERNKIIMQTVSEKKQQAALTILEGVYKRAEDVLVEFAAGEAIHAKQWMASEKTTSLITYNTAIEGYDIGTYDYSTGDGVSYTLNLAVRDIKIEYPA